LLSTLRNLQIADVLITGCFTDSEVVINAMDSTHTGFITTVVDDACASVTEERHEKSIALHQRLFNLRKSGDVIPQIKKEK
jgi:nicotinamidase-related amidase